MLARKKEKGERGRKKERQMEKDRERRNEMVKSERLVLRMRVRKKEKGERGRKLKPGLESVSKGKKRKKREGER